MAKTLFLQEICRAKPPCKDLGGLRVRIFRHPLSTLYLISSMGMVMKNFRGHCHEQRGSQPDKQGIYIKRLHDLPDQGR